MFRKWMFAALLLVAGTAHADFDYASYHASSLQALHEYRQVLIDSHIPVDGLIVSPRPNKVFLTIRYTGKIAKLNADMQQMFSQWIEIGKGDARFASLYINALEIDYQGEPMFIPIQQSLEPYLRDEVKVGDEIRIYALDLAWHKNHPVLVMTEFATR